MVKYLSSLLIGLCLLLASTACFAAGASTTYSIRFLGFGIFEHTITWVADDATAAVNSYTTDGITSAVFMGFTVPSAVTAPTALYDIVLTDENGIDIFGGELMDRSATVAQQALPRIGNGFGTRFTNSKLTFTLTNNAVNSARGKFIFYSILIK